MLEITGGRVIAETNDTKINFPYEQELPGTIVENAPYSHPEHRRFEIMLYRISGNFFAILVFYFTKKRDEKNSCWTFFGSKDEISIWLKKFNPCVTLDKEINDALKYKWRKGLEIQFEIINKI